MAQWILGLVTGIVSGCLGGVLAAAFLAWGAAGIATGVWNLKTQIKGVQDFVTKIPFSKRWAAWQEYVNNASSLYNGREMAVLVREIATEFGSFPHPDHPPGSMPPGNFATLTLDAMPLLTRNIAVRGAIDRVRGEMVQHKGQYGTTEIGQLFSFLYWLLN